MAIETLVVVLGNTNDATGQLSPVAVSRLDTALDYVRALNDGERARTKLVTTGGFGSFNSSPVPHGALMNRYLILNGLPEGALLPFINSNGTIEDGLGVARLLAETEPAVSKLVLVTSGFHIRRARAIFVRLMPQIEIHSVSDRESGTPEQQRHERRAMANLDRELPPPGGLVRSPEDSQPQAARGGGG